MADEVKTLQDAGPVNEIPKEPKKESVVERNIRLAQEREKEIEAQKQAEFEASERERKNDGRKYDYEVEGFNIGDSLMRRMNALDEAVAEKQQEMNEEDMEQEISETEAPVEVPADDTVEESDDIDIDEDLGESDDFELDDIDDEEDIIEEDEEIEEEEEVVEEATEETAEEPASENVVAMPEPAQEPLYEEKKLSERALPEQNELNFDDDDLDGIDIDEEIEEDDDTTTSTNNDNISDEEMELLKEQIREKLIPKAKENAKIINKPVSINQLLSADHTDKHAADWPLMSSGKLISMSRFSGPEIEDLNKQINPRNRFNTMKDIYRNLYNHIVSEKPPFDEWLKTTPFTDIEHIYMAAYKASFFGANYIPMNCTEDSCDHIFLTDDIDMETQMVDFKTEEAKKRFYDILNGEKVSSKSESELVYVTPYIAISLREPTIYNTIFENSILDQKFIDKYQNVLTLMVYIDNIYLVTKEGNRPVALKEYKDSIAKTVKYRIATYSKIIRSLPSDAYNILMARVSEKTEGGEDVSYCFPEVTCPKCGHTIEKSPANANQLLFSRHRLSLLTAQS